MRWRPLLNGPSLLPFVRGGKEGESLKQKCTSRNMPSCPLLTKGGKRNARFLTGTALVPYA